MQNSFWEENVRYWSRSVGLWCCLMLGVITVANSKESHADRPVVAASVVGGVFSLSAPSLQGAVHPNVTLSYSTLDITALKASAYGDMEF